MLSRCLADAAKPASRSVSIGFRFNPILFASKDFATKSNGDKHLTIDRPGRKEEIPRLKQGNTRLKTREIAQETARLKEETARLKEEIALLKGSHERELPSEDPHSMLWQKLVSLGDSFLTERKGTLITSYEVPRGVRLPFTGNPVMDDTETDDTIIERTSHSELYPKILERALKWRDVKEAGKRTSGLRRGILLLGPPGIGKSFALNLLFVRAAPTWGYPIVCDRIAMGSRRFLTFYPARDGKPPRVTVSPDMPEVLDQGTTLYLVDPPPRPDLTLQPEYLIPAFTIVASSPNADNFGSLCKSHLLKKYMCALERDELKEAAAALGLEAPSDHAFTLRDLVVYPKSARAYYYEVYNVISSLTVKSMKDLADVYSGDVGDSGEFSHELVTIVRPKDDPDFEDFKMVPISNMIAALLAKRCVQLYGEDKILSVVKDQIEGFAGGQGSVVREAAAVMPVLLARYLHL